MLTSIQRRLFSGAAALAAAGTLSACSAAAAEPATTADTEAGADSGSTAAATQSGTESSTAGSSSAAEESASGYQDGTYEASGSYVSPGGTESVSVELTLSDGVVTAITVTPGAKHPTSQQYQQAFASGIADEVVGVSIDELDVDAVSGSSLTSGGFNQAVEQIKQDARA